MSIVLGKSNILWLGLIYQYSSSERVNVKNNSGCDFEFNLNCIADVLIRLINIGTLVEKGLKLVDKHKKRKSEHL